MNNLQRLSLLIVTLATLFLGIGGLFNASVVRSLQSRIDTLSERVKVLSEDKLVRDIQREYNESRKEPK